MPRGGKRPGAGRKKGSATKRTRKIADKVSKGDGISPLEVMLEAMCHHHGKGQLDEAAKIAKEAAPYVHPRLGAITHKGDATAPIRIVEELVIVDRNTEASAANP